VGEVAVRELDLHDESLLRAWWETGHAADADRPLDLWPDWAESRLTLPEPHSHGRLRLFGAFEGERMAGSGLLYLSDADNLHLAELMAYVAPPDRRRGIGAAMLAGLERVAADEGRTTLFASARAPLEGDSAGSRFGSAHGYAVANQDTIKAADLRATEATWPGLAEQAAPRLGGYRLVWWLDPTPDDYGEGLAALYSRFLGEIPLGDLDLRPQTFDVARIRHAEARHLRTRHAHLVAAAVAPTGELAGYTDLTVHLDAPRLANIDSTLVLPEHRGHRLGLAMKVLLHQRLRAESPATELVVTGNADVNDHMNAVNEQLGYRPVDRNLELQKVVTSSSLP
jgi:GNAT superfamily N-acetyltransferase